MSRIEAMISTPGLLGLNPSLDLDEASLKEIADITHGAYFRAHDGAELDAIGDTLDQLEPVAQQPTQARAAEELYAWPLALAVSSKKAATSRLSVSWLASYSGRP